MDVALPDTGAIMALDWGQKRIGVAACDTQQTVAYPVTTVTRRSGRRFPLAQLKPILDERQPVGVVMGLPLLPDGTEGDACAAARIDGETFSKKTGLPIIYVDERMSTARAHAGRKELDASANDIDAVTAAVILQQFLDGR